MDNFYIYLIVNNKTGKKYIGSRIVYSGKAEDDIKYMGSSNSLKEDFSRIGIEKFNKRILEEKKFKNKIEVLNRESYYIQKYDTLYPNGYNKVIPNKYPDFNRAGTVTSKETRKKQSISAKKRKIHPWTGKKRPDIAEKMKGENNPMFGKKTWITGKSHSTESIEKIKIARAKQISPMKGKKMSEEAKKKISESLKGRIQSDITKKKRSESMKKSWAEKKK